MGIGIYTSQSPSLLGGSRGTSGEGDRAKETLAVQANARAANVISTDSLAVIKLYADRLASVQPSSRRISAAAACAAEMPVASAKSLANIRSG
jgi:hypothetical protein